MLYKIIHQLLQKFFDALFPPTDEQYIVRNISDDDVAWFFTPRSIGTCTALADFKHPSVRALIHEAKFHADARAQSLLGELFVLYLKNNYIHSPYVVVPVPLSSARMRERGYNQVSEILHAAKKRHPDMHLDIDLLERIRHTKPQTSLTKLEREENVVGAFSLKKEGDISGMHIIVVDDVTTTGATLRATKDALLSSTPASITCIALAH